MIILSQTYPGITVQCGCGTLLAIDPHKDLYEEKYIYCPICHAKININICNAEWRYENNARE